MDNNELKKDIEKDIMKKQIEISESLKQKATKEELDSLTTQIKNMTEEHSKVKESIKSAADEIDRLNKEKTAKQPFSSLMMNGFVKGISEGFNGSKMHSSYSKDVDYASITNPENAYTRMDSGYDHGLFSPLESIFNRVPVTGSAGAVYNNYTVTENADFVAACGEASRSDVDLEMVPVTFKTVKNSIKYCWHAVSDYPQLMSVINSTLISGLKREVNRALIAGNSSVDATEIDGLIVHATDVDTSVAPFLNCFDNVAIIAQLATVVAGQMSNSSLGRYQATHVVMNYFEANKLQAQLNGNGNTASLAFATPDGLNIAGMDVIKDYTVPIDQMYVVDANKVLLFDRLSMKIDAHYNDAKDFEKDMFLIKAVRRMALVLEGMNVGAVARVPSISAALTNIGA